MDWTESNAAGLRSDAGNQSTVSWHKPCPILDFLAVKVFLSIGLFVILKCFQAKGFQGNPASIVLCTS
jgi:hypothetical protein